MRDIQYLSIFGEADAAEAQAMVSEGLAMWIAADTIPECALQRQRRPRTLRHRHPSQSNARVRSGSSGCR